MKEQNEPFKKHPWADKVNINKEFIRATEKKKQDIQDIAWQVSETAENAHGYLIRMDKISSTRVMIEKLYGSTIRTLLYEINIRTLDLNDKCICELMSNKFFYITSYDPESIEDNIEFWITPSGEIVFKSTTLTPRLLRSANTVFNIVKGLCHVLSARNDNLEEKDIPVGCRPQMIGNVLRLDLY